MNLQAQLEILKQQAVQKMIFADSPTSENPNSYYGDTTKTPYHHDHQEHQNIYHHHHDQTHLVYQTGSSGTVHQGGAAENSYHNETSSSGIGEFSIYSDFEQHLFNQDHLKELQPETFGYISFS